MTKETAVDYIVERIDHLIGDEGGGVAICGKIARITVESNLLRQMGGSYTGDTIAASLDYVPEYLPCDFVIDNPDRGITEAGSSAILVREVVKRLSRELDAVVCATMAAHEQTLLQDLIGPKEALKGPGSQSELL